jgi:hypothetical protein
MARARFQAAKYLGNDLVRRLKDMPIEKTEDEKKAEKEGRTPEILPEVKVGPEVGYTPGAPWPEDKYKTTRVIATIAGFDRQTSFKNFLILREWAIRYGDEKFAQKRPRTQRGYTDISSSHYQTMKDWEDSRKKAYQKQNECK